MIVNLPNVIYQFIVIFTDVTKIDLFTAMNKMYTQYVQLMWVVLYVGKSSIM